MSVIQERWSMKKNRYCAQANKRTGRSNQLGVLNYLTRNGGGGVVRPKRPTWGSASKKKEVNLCTLGGEIKGHDVWVGRRVHTNNMGKEKGVQCGEENRSILGWGGRNGTGGPAYLNGGKKGGKSAKYED